ncbi:MAG: UbiD family decarboxylase [Alphaproteobacteria bacterium]|nr:UbiD family decarboxylase [Alphaproteobacteria bacterium]
MADTNTAAAVGTNTNVGARMTYEDMREWIKEAEKLGEVRVVDGLSWESDIGEVAEVVLHDENAPCIIFDNVQGCPPGFRMLINFFAGKRRNMTMGFPTDWNKLELTDAVHKHMKSVKPIPHKIVKSGPILENVLEGDDIDVEKFPAPMWHDKDGGRYIGTGSYNITRDPESGWINIGTYRVMIQSKNEVGFYISPGKHGRIHRDKYEANGESMPACIVLGGDLMAFLMGCTEMPPNENELDILGGYRGHAIECIEGKHTGLPFPANAEIVLEGFIHPNNRKLEGPFGEWTGYYGSDVRPEPLMEIKAIYHRNDPIILGCPPLRPPDELARYRAVTRSAALKENIIKAGVPDVQGVWAHECGTARMLLGISIKQRYPGHAMQTGHVAAMCHLGAYAGKYVVVVDDDIDVSNLEELIWAMITRSDPATSIDIIHNCWSTPLDPRIPPDEKAKGNLTNSRAIIDACRPFHWRDEFPAVNSPPAEKMREFAEKWKHLVE